MICSHCFLHLFVKIYFLSPEIHGTFYWYIIFILIYIFTFSVSSVKPHLWNKSDSCDLSSWLLFERRVFNFDIFPTSSQSFWFILDDFVNQSSEMKKLVLIKAYRRELLYLYGVNTKASSKWTVNVTSPFLLYECVQYHHGNQCVVHIWLLPVRSSVCCAVESHKIVVVVTLLNYMYTEFVYNVCYV